MQPWALGGLDSDASESHANGFARHVMLVTVHPTRWAMVMALYGKASCLEKSPWLNRHRSCMAMTSMTLAAIHVR